MNRVEYMTRLASMLQDIPVEERQEAMKYYNDYFDEAGEENEEKVAAELLLHSVTMIWRSAKLN